MTEKIVFEFQTCSVHEISIPVGELLQLIAEHNPDVDLTVPHGLTVPDLLLHLHRTTDALENTLTYLASDATWSRQAGDEILSVTLPDGATVVLHS